MSFAVVELRTIIEIDVVVDDQAMSLLFFSEGTESFFSFTSMYVKMRRPGSAVQIVGVRKITERIHNSSEHFHL